MSDKRKRKAGSHEAPLLREVRRVAKVAKGAKHSRVTVSLEMVRARVRVSGHGYTVRMSRHGATASRARK